MNHPNGYLDMPAHDRIMRRGAQDGCPLTGMRSSLAIVLLRNGVGVTEDNHAAVSTEVATALGTSSLESKPALWKRWEVHNRSRLVHETRSAWLEAAPIEFVAERASIIGGACVVVARANGHQTSVQLVFAPTTNMQCISAPRAGARMRVRGVRRPTKEEAPLVKTDPSTPTLVCDHRPDYETPSHEEVVLSLWGHAVSITPAELQLLRRRDVEEDGPAVLLVLEARVREFNANARAFAGVGSDMDWAALLAAHAMMPSPTICYPKSVSQFVSDAVEAASLQPQHAAVVPLVALEFLLMAHVLFVTMREGDTMYDVMNKDCARYWSEPCIQA